MPRNKEHSRDSLRTHQTSASLIHSPLFTCHRRDTSNQLHSSPPQRLACIHTLTHKHGPTNINGLTTSRQNHHSRKRHQNKSSTTKLRRRRSQTIPSLQTRHRRTPRDQKVPTQYRSPDSKTAICQIGKFSFYVARSGSKAIWQTQGTAKFVLTKDGYCVG